MSLTKNHYTSGLVPCYLLPESYRKKKSLRDINQFDTSNCPLTLYCNMILK